MDPDHLPPLDSPDNTEPLPPETQPTEQPPSFVRKYRWLVVLLAVVMVGGIVATLTLRNSAQSNASDAAPRTSSTHQSNSTTEQTPNNWKGTVNATAIPLGDGNVATSPQVGYVDSCTTTFRGGGARHSGSWIHSSNNTWNSTDKVKVEGSVNWPSANYVETTTGSSRLLTANDLPEAYPTGTFPISRSDPAYQYDTNPNHIGIQSLSYSLPLNPIAASTPACLPLGPIGILDNGVVLFNALDDAGRDAVAHETQDLCSGHPNGKEMYHYHSVPSCLLDKASGSSTLVGYAFDGYGIYVERDSAGNLPTNADLDACHGRTSQIMWNGKRVSMYHYDATMEYPYTVGCFHGTPATHRP